MTSGLCTLLLLFFLHVSLPQSHSRPSLGSTNLNSPTNIPVLSAYATKSGRVPLQRDSFGFYVEVDLADDSYEASDSTIGNDTVLMMLGLYTSQTLLVNNCLNFTQYDCSKYSCSPVSKKINKYNFTSFTADAYFVLAEAYLDYTYWSLNEWSLVANSCDSLAGQSIGVNRSGIIGLGADGPAQANFQEFPTFSIYIEKDFSSGYLLFQSDLTDDAESATPTAVLHTNPNWESTVAGSLVIGEDSLAINTTLTFDINTDAVGLPLEIYNQFMDFFMNQDDSIQCTADKAYPTCSYSGSIDDLPTIILEMDGQTLSIPPEIYAQQNPDGSKDSILLSVRGLSESLENSSYVTPFYNNTIILGYNFLTYYYCVFGATYDSDYRINIYLASKKSSTPSWVYTLIEVLGTAIFVLICICLYCSCMRRFKNNRRVRPSGIQASGVSVAGNQVSLLTRASSLQENRETVYNNGFSNRLDEYGESQVREGEESVYQRWNESSQAAQQA